MDYHDAVNRVLLEHELEFTKNELFWIDELMNLDVSYDDAFDLVLEEQNPGSIPWLNERKPRKI